MNALRALLLALIGLFIGLAAGMWLHVGIPAGWSMYAAVAMLVIVHALFGAINDHLEGTFTAGGFTLGLVGNMALALALCVLGDRLAVPVYQAAIVYFGWGIFSNFAGIRRHFVRKSR